MKVKELIQSMKYAGRGLVHVYTHEQNFRIQVFAAIFVCILMVAFPLSQLERVALLLLIATVLVLEILNSALETFVDILKPRLAYQVKTVKDMMAAMVLLASLTALGIGFMILGPHIFSMIQ
jgi:diacylglycerol kinase